MGVFSVIECLRMDPIQVSILGCFALGQALRFSKGSSWFSILELRMVSTLVAFTLSYRNNLDSCNATCQRKLLNFGFPINAGSVLGK